MGQLAPPLRSYVSERSPPCAANVDFVDRQLPYAPRARIGKLGEIDSNSALRGEVPFKWPQVGGKYPEAHVGAVVAGLERHPLDETLKPLLGYICIDFLAGYQAQAMSARRAYAGLDAGGRVGELPEDPGMAVEPSQSGSLEQARHQSLKAAILDKSE